MTNTQEAFEAVFKPPKNFTSYLDQNKRVGEHLDKWAGWQACQAHNDAVIAGLVEALIEARKVIDDNLPTRLGQSSKDTIDSLISKHKKV